MPSVLVTIQGPEQRVELALPGDRAVAELLPLLVEVCAGGHQSDSSRWELAPLGGLAFAPERTLAEVGLVDGSVLHLRDAAASSGEMADEAPATIPAEPAAPAYSPPPLQVALPEVVGLPQDRTHLILPPRLPVPDRVAAVVQAVLHAPRPAPAPPLGQPEPGQIVKPSSLTMPRSAGLVARARDSWRSTDYLRRLEDAITGPQLHRCATIAVMSPKGGVGKTTVTTLLGTLFALLRRDRIVAIDTNPDFGSLGRQLAPEHTVFLDDLYEVLDDPQLTATALDNHLGRAAHGLMVLPAPTDPIRVGRLDADAYTRVVRKLQQMVGVIVLDSGTGLHEPAARAALATADQIVLVSDGEPATASLVVEAAAVLRRDGAAIWLVMNKASESTRLDLRAFGAVIPHARGLVEVGTELTAARAVASGRFHWQDAPRSWRRSLRELAAALVLEWPALGIGG